VKPGQPKWTFGGHPPVTLAPIGTGTGAGIPLYRNSAFVGATFNPVRPALVEVSEVVCSSFFVVVDDILHVSQCLRPWRLVCSFHLHFWIH